ncbi:YigZ family protein [Sulfurimonas sp.]|uniref:YigZ family protein n=1 Tax=Sulfurimonas sp. TaxID=2022749 RepID=UPI003562BB6D
MQYINKIYTNTLEVKQSKFITYLTPYAEFEKTLASLKQQHPKARHFVTASRYLNEYNQIVESSSDDGEPKGTSGKPSLMVLQGADIVNIGVIVVRYFGGTKLGTGGLVRAYSDAVNLVLDEAEKLEYKDEILKEITLSYANIGKIEHLCSEYDIKIIDKEFEKDAKFRIKSTKKNLDDFFNKADRLIIN